LYMSAAFDPYHKWLGIPPAEQPPNLYRLLAIPLFETDADVIDGAADGRMSHLRTFSAGKNAQLAQKLLNEISAARVTLLNPQARANYDSQLHAYYSAMEAARLHAQQMQAPPPMPMPVAIAQSEPIASAVPLIRTQADSGLGINARPHLQPRKSGAPVMLLAIVGVLLAAAAVGGGWFAMRGMQESDEVVVKPGTDPRPPTTNPGVVTPSPTDTPADGNATKTPSTVTPTTPPTNTSPTKVGSATPSTTPPTIQPSVGTNPVTPPVATVPPASTSSELKTVEWKGHTGAVYSVVFSANGRFAASGADDRTVRLWDVAQGSQLKQVKLPEIPLLVRISADGSTLATICNGEKTVRVWKADSPEQAVLLDLENTCDHFDLSADGQTLVAGGPNFVQVYDVSSQQELHKLDQDGYDVALSPNGQLFAFGGFHKKVHVNNVQTGMAAAEFQGHSGQINSLDFSADNQSIASSGDRTIRLWNLATTRMAGGIAAPQEIRDVRISGDGRRAVGRSDKTVRVWDLAQGKPIYEFVQPEGTRPDISTDGLSLLTSGPNGVLRLTTLPPMPNAPRVVRTATPRIGPRPSDDPDSSTTTEIAKPKERLPVPASEEIAEAAKTLLEIEPKWETKTFDEQSVLSDRMLQAARSSAKPAEQFATFEFAAKVAAQSGDARKAAKAIDELGANFLIEPVEYQARTLTTMAKATKDEAAVDSLVCVATSVIDNAAAVGRFEEASDLLDALLTACQKPWGKRHARNIGELRTEFTKAKKPWQTVQAAKTRLESDPDNEDANLAVGSWTALEIGDWDAGLPMLAQGGDPKLKQLAELDLAAAQGGPQEQLKAADGWYDAAQSASENQKQGMLRRAGHWYGIILPMIKQQIAKLKIENRLEEISKLPSNGGSNAASSGASRELPIGKWVHVLGLTDLDASRLGGGQWEQRREAIGIETPDFGSRFMLPVEVDGSYELEFDFTAPRGQIVGYLPTGGNGCQLWIAEGQGISGLSFLGGESADRNPTKTPMPKLDWTKRHTAGVKVEPQGELITIEVTIDGKPYMRWKGPQIAFTPQRRNAIRDPRRLGLGTLGGPILFHTAKVKLLDGRGTLVMSANSNNGSRNSDFDNQ
jgi:hypothetical protein